jgi:hypothetical protein
MMSGMMNKVVVAKLDPSKVPARMPRAKKPAQKMPAMDHFKMDHSGHDMGSMKMDMTDIPAQTETDTHGGEHHAH